jgi:hypothetical protein
MARTNGVGRSASEVDPAAGRSVRAMPRRQIGDERRSCRPDSEQPHFDVIRLVLRKPVSLRPALFLEVGNDVLASHETGRFAKKPDRFPDTRFVVSHPPMAHSIAFGALKFVQPQMDRFVGRTEFFDGFPTMIDKL